MNEPQFIVWDEIAIIHEISLERFGGLAGWRGYVMNISFIQQWVRP